MVWEMRCERVGGEVGVGKIGVVKESKCDGGRTCSDINGVDYDWRSC